MSIINLLANQRQVFNFEQRFVRLLVGEVDIITKEIGEFRLKKGELIEFSELLTEVTIINPFPFSQKVEFRVTPVKIGGERSFNIESGAVEVSNLPSLQKVEVSNLPSLQKVEVSNLPSLQKVEQKSGGKVVGLPSLIFTTHQKVVKSNLNRKDLIIRACENNKTAVFVASTAKNSGMPLFAGEVIILNTVSSIALFSEDLKNKIYIMELEND